MTKMFAGLLVYDSRNIATIGQYISMRPQQKEQTLHSTPTTKNLIVKTWNRMKIQLKSKISLDELKPLLYQQSRNSLVEQELQTQQIHPCLKQVCFLESPNFQPQKSVRLLHPPYQREKHLPCHHLQELKHPVLLHNPHKPLHYLPQPSCQYHQHRLETPREQHCWLAIIYQHQLRNYHHNPQEETPQYHHP